MLSKKEILELSPAEEIVEISGGKVIMRGLTAKEYGDYEATLVETAPDGTIKARAINGMWRAGLVALCLTDEDGATFTPEEIARLDAGLVDQLHDVANRLCGVGEKQREKLEAVFGSAQPDGSSSE